MEPAAFPPPDPAAEAPDSVLYTAVGVTTPLAGAQPTSESMTPEPHTSVQHSVLAPYSSLLYLPDPRLRWGLPTAVLTIIGIVLPLAVLILLFGWGVLPSPPRTFRGNARKLPRRAGGAVRLLTVARAEVDGG